MRKTGAMQKGILTAVFLLIMTSLAVASTNVSGQISTNTTWTTTGSPYIVTGDVRVYATSSTPVLTIQAGVTVKFNSGTGLYIGNGASTGKLTANGTSSSRITFTANSSTTKGFYKGIFFDTGAAVTSSLQYADISYGGGGTNAGEVVVNGVSPTISNCTITYSSTKGIYLQNGAAPVMASNTVNNCSSFPLSFDPTCRIASVTSITGATTNTPNQIEVRAGDLTGSNDTWANLSIPYYLPGLVRVFGTTSVTTKLTVSAGANLRFNIGAQLKIGNETNPALKSALYAVGTSSSIIKFTSNKATPAAGDWGGIQLLGGVDNAATSIQYATVEYAGSSGWGIGLFSCNPQIKNTVTVRYSSGIGILMNNSASTLQTVTLANNTGYAVRIEGTAGRAANLSSLTFTSNGKNAVEYVRSDIRETAETLSYLGTTSVYEIPNGISVHGQSSTAAKLTVAGGVNLKFINGSGLFVGGDDPIEPGILVVSGTSSLPVIMEGSAATAGNWGGLGLYDSVVDASTTIDYATIRYAGGGILIANCSPTIRNSTISNSSENGITIQGAASPTMTSCTSRNNGGYPLEVSAEVRMSGITGMTCTANGTNMIHFFGRQVEGSGDTYPNCGVPYMVEGSILVRGEEGESPKLKLQPGVEMRFSEYESLIIGDGSDEPGGANHGSLEAIGTSSQRIILRSRAMASNMWNGLYIDNASIDASTRLSYVTISEAGQDGTALYISGANPTIDHTTINGATQYGITLWESAPTVSSTTITNAGVAPILASANSRLKNFSSITFDSGAFVDYSGGHFSGTAETLPGFSIPYRVSGWIDIYGDLETAASLTLAAGAKLHFMPATGINVGSWNDASQAIFKCTGTGSAHVELTGDDGGSWDAVDFVDGSVNGQTRLDYTTIDMAGTGSNRAVYVRNCSPIFSHCSFLHSPGYGIWSESSPELQVAQSTFDSNGGYPISIDQSTDIAGIIDYTFTNNNPDEIEMRGGSVANRISTDTHWTVAKSPYYIAGDVVVAGLNGNTATLTIDPGVVVRFEDGADLRIGLGSDEHGRLVAEGTAGSPITFTAKNGTNPGSCVGLIFDDAADDSSVLQNVFIEYAGGNGYLGAITIHSANPTITSCEIHYSGTSGIQLEENAAPAITGLNVTNCAQYVFSFDSTCRIASIEQVQGDSSNGTNMIEARSGDLTGTNEIWHKQGVPYLVRNRIMVYGTETTPVLFQIDAGTILRMMPDGHIVIGSWDNAALQGAFSAVGTEGEPIIFTSEDAAPPAGRWPGLIFLGGTVGAQTIIQHAVIEYGGAEGAPARMYNSNPTISHTVIRGSNQMGVLMSNSAAVLTDVTVTESAGYAILIEGEYGRAAGLSAITMTGNGIDAVEYSRDVREDLEILPYLGGASNYDIPNGLWIHGNETTAAKLQIAGGSTLRFLNNNGISVGIDSDIEPGILEVMGTETNPVWMKGPTEDPNSWRGIYFDSSTVDAETTVSYTNIINPGNHK